MRILWRFLPSPLPLLKLFNGLYFSDFSQRWVGLPQFMPGHSDRQLHLQRLIHPPTPHELRIFAFYTQFVRRIFSLFSSKPPRHIDIPVDAFHIIWRALAGPPFPHIQHVVIPPLEQGSLSLITPFLSRRLQELHLHIPAGSSTFIRQVSIASASILRLVIFGHVSSRDLLEMRTLSHLQHLSINFLDEVSQEEDLDQHQALKTMSLPSSLLSIHLHSPSRLQIPFLSTATLCKISRFYISGPASRIAANLVLTAALVEVRLDFTNRRLLPEIVAPSLRALAAASRHTLRSVTILANGSLSLRESIGPLLEIPFMESFVVRHTSCNNFDLVSRDLQGIVDAWPYLTRLALPINIVHTPFCLEDLRTISKLYHLRFLLLMVGREVAELPLNGLRYERKSQILPYLKRYFTDSQLYSGSSVPSSYN